MTTVPYLSNTAITKADIFFKANDTAKRVEMVIAERSLIATIAETELSSRTVLSVFARKGSVVLLGYWMY